MDQITTEFNSLGVSNSDENSYQYRNINSFLEDLLGSLRANDYDVAVREWKQNLGWIYPTEWEKTMIALNQEFATILYSGTLAKFLMKNCFESFMHYQPQIRPDHSKLTYMEQCEVMVRVGWNSRIKFELHPNTGQFVIGGEPLAPCLLFSGAFSSFHPLDNLFYILGHDYKISDPVIPRSLAYLNYACNFTAIHVNHIELDDRPLEHRKRTYK